MQLDTFLCCDCNEEFPVKHDGGTGYAREPETWRYICYGCCGKRDLASMIINGKATLYLTMQGGVVSSHRSTRHAKVSNWPGTLTFATLAHEGRHNVAGKRYDVWFTGPEGARWHGVTFGDNTQICHCKRTRGLK